MQCGLERPAIRVAQLATAVRRGDRDERREKMFDPSVAIAQEAERLVESVIG
jgi:hypothetical protein